MLLKITALLLFLGFEVSCQQQHGYSTSCGDLISKDGYRFDLTPLKEEGVQSVKYTSLNGSSSTILYSICGNITQCGNRKVGACLNPNTNTGLFSFALRVTPLLMGIGVQLEYWEGELIQFGSVRTVITIACYSRPGFNDVVADGELPNLSIRIRSSSGCPAHGGYPPSFPFQHKYRKYTYKTDPTNGVFEDNFALDSTLQRERRASIVIDGGDETLYNFGDFDQYHNLSCYYINYTQPVVPFQLPENATFLGTQTTRIYNPITKSFDMVMTDSWKYTLESNCVNTLWFLSGKAVPIQQLFCNGETTIYVDFQLGQPNGDNFDVPKCYPYMTCGSDWNTCKYPYCCANNQCSLCPNELILNV